jgi:hypothetical protein
MKDKEKGKEITKIKIAITILAIIQIIDIWVDCI